MKKYLSDIFGVNVKIENWDGKLQLPLYLRNKREYYMLSLGERQSILMKNESGYFNVASFEKEIKKIENKYKTLKRINIGLSIILFISLLFNLI